MDLHPTSDPHHAPDKNLPIKSRPEETPGAALNLN